MMGTPPLTRPIANKNNQAYLSDQQDNGGLKDSVRAGAVLRGVLHTTCIWMTLLMELQVFAKRVDIVGYEFLC
jgi:hypothetical protein